MDNQSNIFSDTYIILEKLGAGSGGVVYKAYHRRLQKEVVIKELLGRDLNMQLKRKETDILKNLKHSFLPQVLDFLEVEGNIYTVMSFVPGKSFQQLLKEGKRFTQKQLVRWGMQLCSALNYLHNQNPPIIHGDIKPANIMLTPEGDICLIDFNIACFLDENTVLGYSKGYTSPEQYMTAMGEGSGYNGSKYSRVDEKSDIYSLGATLYHLATGQKIVDYNKPVDFFLLEENTSEAFAAIIQKAMQLEARRRYKDTFDMFRAFQSIGKKDKRYKKLLAVQRIVWIMQILILAGFIVLGGYGFYKIKKENISRYNELVEEQIEYRKEKDYKSERDVHEEAVKIFPSGLESYYQNALTLYEQQEYEKCIEFIDYDILEDEEIDLLDKRTAEIYYIKAECHYELQEYQEAVDAFEQVFEYGGGKSSYYRDYAVALVYDEQEARAREILEEAIDNDLAEDSIYYVKGEIEKASEQYEAAEEAFLKCIKATEEDNLKTRSYIMLGQIYRETNHPEKELAILREARDALPAAKQMMILEQLVQINIDFAERTGDAEYQNEAIELLNEVIEQGWDTWQTYDNLVLLRQKQGDLEGAGQQLAEMQEKYGDIYQIYKRYAFLEIERQEQSINENRDYEKFAEYYRKAVELYHDQLKDNNTDMEMELLEDVYQQVLEGGWM